MVKSAKHKAQRAADFKKTKLKLGSGKGKNATAKTATDTSFKSRTIALPQQSITADKSQAIVTRRNLTLDDLLGQTRHYNAATRKDALFGLRELLSLHPFLLHKPGILASVLSAALRLIPDEDPTVRKAVFTFLSFLLPALKDEQDQSLVAGSSTKSAPALLLYAPSLILYTVSALSHIFTEVRIDALRILNLLLDHIPEAVVRGWDGFAPALRSGSHSGGGGSGEADASTSRRNPDSTGPQVITCLLTILGIPDLSTLSAQQMDLQRNPNSASSSSLLSGMSTATAVLPASARLLLFETIGKFLNACDRAGASRSGKDVAENDLRCPTWFMRSAFSSSSDCEAFEHFLRLDASQTGAEGDDGSTRILSVASAQYMQEGDSLLDAYGQSSVPAWTTADLQATLGATTDLLAAFAEDAMEEQEIGSAAKQKDGAYRKPSLKTAPSRFSVLASALAPVFLNSFLDSASPLFSPDAVFNTASLPASQANPAVGLDLHGTLILAIVKATLTLWRSLASSLTSSAMAGQARKLSNSQMNDLSTFLSKLAPYFPFSEHIPGASSRTPQQTEEIVEMELAYAEVVALCMFCLDSNTAEGAERREGRSAKGTGKRKASMREMLLHQLDDVGEYIIETLLGERPASAGMSGKLGGAITAPLSSATFAELLPTIWLLMNLDHERDRRAKLKRGEEDSDEDSDEEKREEAAELSTRLVEAIVTYFGKANRGKALIFELVARLTVLHCYPSYSAHFSPLRYPAILKVLRKWFQSLPRVLWDAATKKDIRLANAILEYLRTICAVDDGELFSHEDIDSLHAPLAVFFHIQHPSRGSLQGPYARLPLEAQNRAKALLYYLQPLDTKLSSAAAEAGAL
ncbi:unnamed protein product [Tilletia laevis]|uniref:Pre-rRNA-processing protein n=1 Tax=Tilletia laevis TaxID=157183 RepID=A0A9N8M3J4_9BASI|nr:unnamed protein product [Tilletia laevis]CAD6968024.1 unnamed protein product [Tilletia controversa]